MKSQMKGPGRAFVTLNIFISSLVLLGWFHRTAGDENEIPVAECKAIIIKLVKGQLMNVKNCLSEMEFINGKEKSEKMLCVIVCAMKKSGFLDAESRPDAAASLSFLESTIPPGLRDRVMDAFIDCHEHLGTIIHPDDDPYCKSFEPLMKCAQNGLNKVCK